MKPVSVRFRCFGPYMAEQFIDFEALEKSGLFLICGETGAGKTTILDAICYALYGRSSGGLRGDISVMRCKLAGKNDETLVEFIFDSNGKRYKFIRSLKYGRKNLNDSHNCLVLEGGEYVPIFENPKATVVNKKAEELIGLTYDQFRQVIILPQGQFEKLLVSNSEEKEKILVSLFHADRWQRIAEEIARRVQEQDGKLKQEKLQISLKLKGYSCENLLQLEEKREEIQTQLDDLQVSAAVARQQWESQKAAYEQALLQNQAFETLAKLEGEYARLEGQKGQFTEEEKLLARADAAEAIRMDYAACQDAKQKKCRAEGSLAQKEEKCQIAEQSLGEVKAQADAQEAARPEQEQRKKRLTLLENARQVYQTLEEKSIAAETAAAALKTAEKSEKQAETAFLQEDQSWQASVLAQEKAMEDYRLAQNLYLQGIGSVLARQLISGEPCPVCGSREHPAPAVAAEGHITEQRLDDLTKAMNDANDAAAAARRSRSRAETARKDAAATANQARQTEMAARLDWEHACAGKMPGIDTIRQLEDALEALSQQIRAFDKEDSRLMDALQRAQSDRKAAEAEQNLAREEAVAAQAGYAQQLARWQAALSGAGFEREGDFLACAMEPEEKQRRREALLQFRGDLNRAYQQWMQQKQLLEGQLAPDLVGLRKQQTAAEEEWKERNAQLVLTQQLLKTMTSDLAELEKRTLAHDAARCRVDGDLEFANRLRGRSGISLQRYVLGVMLSAITAEANRLLGGVYSGRYRLYRTDEVAGASRKSGLELEVYDSHNQQRRSVTTLSGGEKFLVALSLAIGLSTVVQAQGSGIRLEAMFIDEGFGSLDREAVNDALEVLQGIRRSAGIVGIISHVEALAETIPAKIEIQKGKSGSNCMIIC
mgnify:CR=1 FL=1